MFTYLHLFMLYPGGKRNIVSKFLLTPFKALPGPAFRIFPPRRDLSLTTQG